VVDVVLYAAALFLEFAALIALRVREPRLPRPYRVPGGLPGVVLLALLPLAIVIAAVVNTVQTEGIEALYLSLAALATGPIAYPVCRALFRRGRPGLDVDAEIAAVAYSDSA
jgi:amino acid transporter